MAFKKITKTQLTARVYEKNNTGRAYAWEPRHGDQGGSGPIVLCGSESGGASGLMRPWETGAEGACWLRMQKK